MGKQNGIVKRLPGGQPKPDPTPQEIEERAAIERSRWSEEERRRRDCMAKYRVRALEPLAIQYHETLRAW